MKALEMEDEEVERFLDAQEADRPSPSRAKAVATSNGTNWRTSFFIGLAIVMAVLYLVSLSSNDATPSTPSSPTTPVASPASGDVPTSTNIPDESAASKKSMMYSHIATIPPEPDHKPVDEDTRKALTEKWGKWHFYDGDEERRPTGDYMAKYPNRDIPGNEFPDDAWQTDAVYVNHFIDDAEKLIARAKEAIFTEYGHGKPLPPEGLAERLQMFHWDRIDLQTATGPPPKYGHGRTADHGNGGWTTDRSFNGLVRRLLHAMMTNDQFTIVMAGHSAAAGHGNHFRQSYTHQMHRILAPIFARLGVKLITRNMSQGGLGTIHHTLGFKDMYGDEIDLVLWDSGMTEGNQESIDLFYRQALLSGKRVPVIWGGDFHLLQNLHNNADADVGEFGVGSDGIILSESEDQVKQLPYAVQYMKCATERQDLCASEPRFCVNCWVKRPDIDEKKMFPSMKDRPGGQVRWHPGWRDHQIIGRVLAFAILDALQVAFQTWSEGTMGGPPLDDDFWHVTKYYDNIRQKVTNLDHSLGSCYGFGAMHIPARVCNTVMKGRGLHTPRANPAKSSLLTLIRPDSDGYVPFNPRNVLYEGPDAPSPCFSIPDTAVDVYAIVTGRRMLSATRGEQLEYSLPSKRNETISEVIHRDLAGEDILPGKGWELIDEFPGECDGDYEHHNCGRAFDAPCPVAGHQDSRGTLSGSEFAGWLVLDIPDVQEGLILLRVFTWLVAANNPRTAGWTSVNNESGRRRSLKSASLRNATRFADSYATTSADSVRPDSRLQDEEDGLRRLLPESFRFEFAVNGKITSWTEKQVHENTGQLQRVVEVITLLDDPQYPKGNVSVAIRILGCDHQCAYGVPHIYWA